MTELHYPDKLNAAVELVDKNLELGRGKKIAIYYQDQVLTYGDVYRSVNKMGNVFKSLGLEIENRVMLLMHDCPEFVASFFGAIKIGSVPIPTNSLFKSKDYLYLLNDSRAKILVVSEPLLPQIDEIKSELRYLKHVIVVGNAGPGHLSYADVFASAADELEPVDTSKDDAAFWLYSSGTTGFPKGTVHLHHDMLVCSDLYAKRILGINENDITFSVAKLFFAYGLGNSLYFPFSVGAATVLWPEHPKPPGIFATIKKYKPTLFFGVPTAYAGMLQQAETLPAVETSSIRCYMSAGEALPKVLLDSWLQKFGMYILDGIGSTELGHVFISNRPDDVKAGSSGRLVPGYEAKIVDPDGLEVPANEIGDLRVKGESLAAYYWNKHEKNKETFFGPWINTGDKYYKDEQGYFWYVGRGDDMLKPGGIWVSPLEVENTLMEHPSVYGCVVIGVVDKDNLEKPKAYIVLKDGITPSEELAAEIRQYVKGKIAPYKYPRWIQFVDELPKTASGKILRYKLRQLSLEEIT